MKYLIFNLLVSLFFVSSVSKAEVIKDTIPGEGLIRNQSFLSVGPGLAFLNGNTGWAVNVGFLRSISSNDNLYVGADLGLNFWSYASVATPVGNSSADATGVQLLPTAIYRFDLTGNRTIFPYIGLSVGPHIFVQHNSVAAVGGTATSTNSNVYLEMLLRPGFFTHLSSNVALNVEGKLGILRSDFIFLPQLNAVITL